MFRLTVADVFVLKGRGLVATGRVESGTIRVGDEVTVDGGRAVRVKAIEAFRRVMEEASAGDMVGLLLDGVQQGEVASGTVLSAGDDQAHAPVDLASRRTELERMRDAGLMTDEQIETDLRSP